MQRKWTEQEAFWSGSFGDDYVERNRGADWIANNTMFFARIFERAGAVQSVLEFGANIGLNLRAIRNLLPRARLSGIEINAKAAAELRTFGDIDVYEGSFLDFDFEDKYDFVFTKNVLIHVNPLELPSVYDALWRASNRYIMVCEYYNPTPVEINYRGYAQKLFKRDFAGEMLDRFPDLTLVSYGFVYRRESFHQDDVTWFLLRKGSNLVVETGL